ncbi:MAG: hypothetical protein PF495_05005, partial [Spirochaetales bacterium]|nr:hypothetical protein [Spirochaetales bacterium]
LCGLRKSGACRRRRRHAPNRSRFPLAGETIVTRGNDRPNLRIQTFGSIRIPFHWITPGEYLNISKQQI